MSKRIFDKMYKMCSQVAINNKDLREKTERSQVGCCIVGGSGNFYTGINIGWWHSSCAEVTALSNAWQNGERKLKYVMAVKLNKRNDALESVTPCGICREMFNQLHPEVKIVYIDDGEYVVKSVDEMLPDIDDEEEKEV